MAYATIENLYLRFGKHNVIRNANIDGLDELDRKTERKVRPRLNYFLEMAFEQINDALRQGRYNPEDFTAPYPKTLVNLNMEMAYVALYRTRHSDDESPPDAFSALADSTVATIRNIQAGVVRFDNSIPKAMSIPANVNASIGECRENACRNCHNKHRCPRW